MISIQQGLSKAESVMTSGAAAVHSSQITMSASGVKSSCSRDSLPHKRPSVSDVPGKKPSNKKRASKEEGRVWSDWSPAEQIAFLRAPHRQATPTEQVSTDLALYECPFKVKKKLQESDLGYLSRLLLPKADVKSHILPLMSDECVLKVGSDSGMEVVMWDRDTDFVHLLVFKYWSTSKSFLLNGHWVDKFVRRRGLKVGDEIGLFWCRHDQKFCFTVHKRAG